MSPDAKKPPKGATIEANTAKASEWSWKGASWTAIVGVSAYDLTAKTADGSHVVVHRALNGVAWRASTGHVR